MMKLITRIGVGGLSLLLFSEILGCTGWSLNGQEYPFGRSFVAIAAPDRPYRQSSGVYKTREVCSVADQPIEELMAFLPAHSNAPDRTTTAAPTFYFYVFDRSENVASLEFRLGYASGDQRGKGVLNPPLNVPIPPTPGVVKVKLPEILEKSTTYAWSLTLRCQQSGETFSLKGSLVYQDLDAKAAIQLAQANSVQQKAAIYSEAGFWLDAVPMLMEDEQLETKSFEAMIAATGLDRPIVESIQPIHP
jgi:hypothetical protein